MTHGCPRCNGSVVIAPEQLPDRTYELKCLRCGNRNFPPEMEIAVNMIIKLRKGLQMLIELAPIIGIITGIVAIAGMVYGFGFKFSSLETKVNLIWSVFVEDALRGQLKAGTITHSSPYRITNMRRTEGGEKLGELIPPEIYSKLEKKKFKSDQDVTLAFIKLMGMPTILKESGKLSITVQEYLAFICVELKTK